MRALLSVAGVIQLGGPPTLNWCIDEQHCAIFGVPPTKPPAPGTNQTLTPGGPFSTNCTDNPNWCHANMAQISMGCTMDLLMGANNHTVSPNHTVTPFGSEYSNSPPSLGATVATTATALMADVAA